MSAITCAYTENINMDVNESSLTRLLAVIVHSLYPTYGHVDVNVKEAQASPCPRGRFLLLHGKRNTDDEQFVV